MPAAKTETHAEYSANIASGSNTAERRRRAFADSPEDISAAGQGAERMKKKDDPMVMVEIAKDYNLTSDDHVIHHYKAGVDEMPLSHAKHWWSRNAGGVKLFVGKRASAAQKAIAEEVNSAHQAGTVAPPDPDPEVLKSLDLAVPATLAPVPPIQSTKK